MSASCGSNSDKRNRSANFTVQEMRALIDYVVRYKDVIENKRKDSDTWKEKEDAWNKISVEFNWDINSDWNRSAKVLRVKYEAIKKNLRRKASKNKLEMYQNGGFLEPYTDYEEKLIPILNLDVEDLHENDNKFSEVHVKEENILDESYQEEMDNLDESNIVPAAVIISEELENGSMSPQWNKKNRNNKRHKTSAKIETNSNLSQTRNELLSLKIELARKDLEFKENEIKHAECKYEMEKKEHLKRMELLDLQIQSYNSTKCIDLNSQK